MEPVNNRLLHLQTIYFGFSGVGEYLFKSTQIIGDYKLFLKH